MPTRKSASKSKVKRAARTTGKQIKRGARKVAGAAKGAYKGAVKGARKTNPVTESERKRMRSSSFALPKLKKYALIDSQDPKNTPARANYALTLLNQHYKTGARSKREYAEAYVNIMRVFKRYGKPAKRPPLVRTTRTLAAYASARAKSNPVKAPPAIAARTRLRKGTIVMPRAKHAIGFHPNLADVVVETKGGRVRHQPLHPAWYKRALGRGKPVWSERDVFLKSSILVTDKDIEKFKKNVDKAVKEFETLAKSARARGYKELAEHYETVAADMKKTYGTKKNPTKSRKRTVKKVTKKTTTKRTTKKAPAKKATKKVARKSVVGHAPKRQVVRQKKYYVVWNIKPPKFKIGTFSAKMDAMAGPSGGGFLSGPTSAQKKGFKNLQVFHTKKDAESFLRALKGKSWAKAPAKKRVTKKAPAKRTTKKRVTKKAPAKKTKVVGTVAVQREKAEVYRRTAGSLAGGVRRRVTVVVRKVQKGGKSRFHVRVLKGAGLPANEKKAGNVLFKADYASRATAVKAAKKWLATSAGKNKVLKAYGLKPIYRKPVVKKTKTRTVKKAVKKAVKKTTKKVARKSPAKKRTRKSNPTKDVLHFTTRQKTRGSKKVTQYYVLLGQSWVHVNSKFAKASLKAGSAVKVPWSHGSLPHHAPGDIIGDRELGLMMHNWHMGQGDPIYAAGSTMFAGKRTSQAYMARALDAIRSLRSSKPRDKELRLIEKNLEHRVGVRKAAGAAKARPKPNPTKAPTKKRTRKVAKKNPTTKKRATKKAPSGDKVVASSFERYNGGVRIKRQWGSSTVTRFYVYKQKDRDDAKKWKIIEGYGKTPGERKTYAIDIFKGGGGAPAVRGSNPAKKAPAKNRTVKKAAAKKTVKKAPAKKRVAKKRTAKKAPCKSCKVRAVQIKLERPEESGNPDSKSELNSPNVWLKANQTLARWARTAPPGTYEKVNFRIKFENGEVYKGRYELKKVDMTRANLAEHVRLRASVSAGRYNPGPSSEAQYKKWLKSTKVDSKAYAKFLDGYQIG